MVGAGAADSEEARGETSSDDMEFIRASSTQTQTSVKANVSFPASGSSSARSSLLTWPPRLRTRDSLTITLTLC